ncbi:replication-associated recombination protein A [uncultured Cytophaga sp.]|uniref:replication-associated recombination protein A n=1 Tax=uncultured Cytophaga sp. TaxID=160238 RepID=UPI002636C513|nr:replication-associated recombination protein A [uncultured Cytophaga sp.]
MQLIPLAERMRPQTIDEVYGQKHLIGEGMVFRRFVEEGKMPSMILWGPPGVGKTTLAQLLANKMGLPFYTLSAISAGVKEVREVIANAQQQGKAVLFIDEIHRFSKSQQDALLGAVEKGIIQLIGATTENPSFQVISALLSRSQVYVLQSLSEEELVLLMHHAIQNDAYLKTRNITIQEHESLLRLSGGDARKLLNLLELVIDAAGKGDIVITDEYVQKIAQKKVASYDKNGEMHYDVISAFIKSVRGSDPNAAVYWLARMIEGGEEVDFIARRLLILASEDIGNANPTALVMATTAFDAVRVIGWPESRIILSQVTTYLASSPKSNASYMAINEAQQLVRSMGDLPVPLHLRNAPTKLMKNLDYGKEYKYAHSYENNFVEQEYMPDKLANKKIYEPGNSARENELRVFLQKRWKAKYKY